MNNIKWTTEVGSTSARTERVRRVASDRQETRTEEHVRQEFIVRGADRSATSLNEMEHLDDIMITFINDVSKFESRDQEKTLAFKKLSGTKN